MTSNPGPGNNLWLKAKALRARIHRYEIELHRYPATRDATEDWSPPPEEADSWYWGAFLVMTLC